VTPAILGRTLQCRHHPDTQAVRDATSVINYLLLIRHQDSIDSGGTLALLFLHTISLCVCNDAYQLHTLQCRLTELRINSEGGEKK